MRIFSHFFLFLISTFPTLGQAPVIEWQKCYGGSGNDRPGSIVQLMNGDFVVCGITDSNDGDVSGLHGLSDYWITRLDQIGNIVWQKCYGGSFQDFAISVVETYDYGLIVCGQAASFDGNVTGNHSIPPRYDAWVLKLDSSGNLQWQKCYGGSDDETGYNIIQTSDSGYAVAGWTTSNDGDVSGNHSTDTADVWLIKLDSVGTLQWQRCYGGTNEDKAYSIIQTPDGGFALTGYTLSNNGDVSGNHDSTSDDIWLLKVDNSGSIEWQKCIGGTAHEAGQQIIQTTDNDFLIVGVTTSSNGDVNGNHGMFDFWLVNLDSTGNLISQRCYGGTNIDEGYSIAKNNSGGYVLGGSSYSNDGDVSGNHGVNKNDYWVVGIDSIFNLEWQRCYGGSENEFFRGVISTYGDGFLAYGETRSNNGDVSGHHQPLYAGDYWVVKLSAPYVIVQDPNESVDDFSVYHNLSRNTIEVSFYTARNEKVEAEVFDVAGRVILESKFVAEAGLNKNVINVQNLNSGIYLVRLNASAGGMVKKLIVK